MVANPAPAGSLVGYAFTQSNGTYTISGLPVGSYDVEFVASNFGGCPYSGPGYVTQWYNDQPDQPSANAVAVTAGSTTGSIDADMVGTTSFAITVNGGPSATIAYGTAATLAESGLPGSATGTVVFSSSGNPDLCTITLPATSCHTSTALPAGSYSPISAAFTDTDGGFTGSTSTNTVVLTVSKAPPSTPTISNLPASGINGGGFTATVSTTGDGVKSVTSNSTSVCTVSGFVVSYVDVGTCSLTAHVATGTNYTAADGSARPSRLLHSAAASAGLDQLGERGLRQFHGNGYGDQRQHHCECPRSGSYRLPVQLGSVAAPASRPGIISTCLVVGNPFASVTISDCN